MIGLYIDPATGDLALDASGALRLATGREAVAQHARQRLMTHEGEWFLDTTAGIPWFARIMGKAFNADAAEAVVKTEVAGTPGVAGIEGLSASFVGPQRELRVRDLRLIFEEGL